MFPLFCGIIQWFWEDCIILNKERAVESLCWVWGKENEKSGCKKHRSSPQLSHQVKEATWKIFEKMHSPRNVAPMYAESPSNPAAFPEAESFYSIVLNTLVFKSTIGNYYIGLSENKTISVSSTCRSFPTCPRLMRQALNSSECRLPDSS